MKNYFWPLIALIGFGCAHIPRTPSHVSFADAQNRILEEIKQDENLVSDIKHATKLYSHGHQTERSILIMHGLHESPEYMKGFANYFFNKGYNVLSLRLPNHMMKNPDEINHVKARQWVVAAEKAFNDTLALGNRTEVLGYSTGGTLGVYLALNYPGEVKNLYLVAPALALSNQVFLGSTLAGWTKRDSSSVCEPQQDEKYLCRVLLSQDAQFKAMVKEGIYTSPAAGFQVQSLINIISQQFNPPGDPSSVDVKDYYKVLEAIYLKLKVPMVMINTELDNVVTPRFNNNLMSKYSYPHKQLYFKKELKISHIMINKSVADAFIKTPSIYNPYFDKMTELIDQPYQ